ncbi:MAG: hypothetical protein ACTSU5_09680 [Promethearchaeota archaeon]
MIDRKLYHVLETLVGADITKKYTENFDDRLAVQKILYLATHCTPKWQIKFPYSWSFYLRGSYSSGIAHAIFHMEEVEWDRKAGKTIEEDEELAKKLNHHHRALTELGKLYEEINCRISWGEFLELASTIVYVGRDLQKKVKKNNEIGIFDKKLLEVVEKLKPHLVGLITGTQQDLQALVTILKKNKYFKS